MRVLFFGTSPFAVPALTALHGSARHTILAVVTQPDRPSGRGLQATQSPVKKAASLWGYPIYQPERVRRAPFPDQARALAPEVLVVVSFGQIIPQALLDLPRYGGINVHASLLPRWRGAAPIHRAILAGDTETGVATMQMEATLDTGPVYLVHREPIRPQDTTQTLEPRLAAAGASLLLETLDGLEAGALTATPQPADGVTYAAMVDRATGLLDPTAEDAAALWNRLRALTPRPGCHLLLAGREVKVLAARIGEPTASPPGTVAAITRDGIAVATVEGTLCLTTLQPPGKAAMPAAAYANGARLCVGDPAAAPA